jgi:hypothetical protein
LLWKLESPFRWARSTFNISTFPCPGSPVRLSPVSHGPTAANSVKEGVAAFPSPGTPGEGRVGVSSKPGDRKDPHPNPPPAYREREQMQGVTAEPDPEPLT